MYFMDEGSWIICWCWELLVSSQKAIFCYLNASFFFFSSRISSTLKSQCRYEPFP